MQRSSLQIILTSVGNVDTELKIDGFALAFYVRYVVILLKSEKSIVGYTRKSRFSP